MTKHDDFCPCTRFRAQEEFCTCGAPEIERIVQETSDAFARRLTSIMSGHSFETHAPSGIRICTACGKAETRRNKASACAA